MARLGAVGNRRFNLAREEGDPVLLASKPGPAASRGEKQRFIQRKYGEWYTQSAKDSNSTLNPSTTESTHCGSPSSPLLLPTSCNDTEPGTCDPPVAQSEYII